MSCEQHISMAGSLTVGKHFFHRCLHEIGRWMCWLACIAWRNEIVQLMRSYNPARHDGRNWDRRAPHSCRETCSTGGIEVSRVRVKMGDVQVMVNMHVQDFLMITTTKLVTPAFTGS